MTISLNLARPFHDLPRAAMKLGATLIVRAPLRKAVSQRAIGIANGAWGGPVDSRGGAVPAGMSVRVDHRRVRLDRASLATTFSTPSSRLVVFLHGLMETERAWFHGDQPGQAPSGTDFGSRLAEDLACTPVYVRYNTGRHVSDNGRALVDLLSQLIEEWPTTVAEVVLVGHSMGGLVARSAVHHAGCEQSPWLSRVAGLLCLGTPHTGAPLGRAAARTAALLKGFILTAPLSALLGLRSDGIKDLAYGYLREDERSGDDTEPIRTAGTEARHPRQCFVVATLARSEGSAWARLAGDLFVGPTSAGDPSQNADIRWLGGLHHLDLLRHDTVYITMLRWLTDRTAR